MGKQIVLQDEIDYQISLLKVLSGNEGYRGTQEALKTTLNNINNSLGKELRGNYVRIIGSINNDFDGLCGRADVTQVLLQKCKKSFVNMDQAIASEIKNNGECSLLAKFINNELKTKGSVLSGELSGDTDIFGITTAGTVSGSLLYGEAGIKNKMSWKYKDDDGNWDFKSFGLSSEAKATGALAKGKTEGNIGYLHGSAEGSVITGAVSGEAKATLWDDGKFNPAVSVGAKVEGSVLQGKAEAGLGSDQYGIYGKADGDLLHAEADAKMGAGYIGKDENGNAQYGVSAEASAMASVAQGKVKGGITVFGIDIDVGIKGYAGAAGVEVGGSINTSGVHANVSGALALGAGLDVSVDWSDAEWIGDTADFIVDFADDTIDFIGDVGSATWEGITFVTDNVVDALFGWL